MKLYRSTLYSCDCGYETTNSGNMSKHKKNLCGHKIFSETVEFIKKKNI